MTAKLKVLLTLVLCGLILGVLPVTSLYAADDHHAHSSDQDSMVSASIQFMLVHIEQDTLERLMEESKTQTLDSIPLEKIGECIRAKDGAQIVSQTRLAVVSGYEAKMTLIETDHREAKTRDQQNVEQAHRETEVSIMIKVEHRDGNKLAARFVYDRSVSSEEYVMGEEAEEEEAIEQKFDLSSGILLQAGQMHIAGASLNQDRAAVLLIKADL
jgi:hypothetical protein